MHVGKVSVIHTWKKGVYFFLNRRKFFSWEGKGQLEGGDVYIVYREVNEIFLRNIINKLLDGIINVEVSAISRAEGTG